VVEDECFSNRVSNQAIDVGGNQFGNFKIRLLGRCRRHAQEEKDKNEVFEPVHIAW
jgi:hypothetical protein